MDPNSTKQTESNMYQNGTYLHDNPDWHSADSPWKAAQILRILKRNALSPHSVCEVGSGAGEILVQLSKVLGEQVQLRGYDISPQALAICKPKEGPNLHFYLENLLDKAAPCADLILAIDVLEHVEDCFGFLRQLRPKGAHHIFHIPLDLSAQTVLRGSPLMKARLTVGHLHYFTQQTALAILKETGYEIIDHFYTSPSLELKNRALKTCLLQIPRQLLYLVNQNLAARLLGGFSLLVLTR